MIIARNGLPLRRRVAERGGRENRCRSRFPGFKTHALRGRKSRTKGMSFARQRRRRHRRRRRRRRRGWMDMDG